MDLTTTQILNCVELFNKYSDSEIIATEESFTDGSLKELVNNAYSDFTKMNIVKETFGADNKYSIKEMCFVKAIYKLLMRYLPNPVSVPIPPIVTTTFDDWFLPSVDTALLMINNLNPLLGFGSYNFKDSGYWTSSENDATTAFVYDGGGGIVINNQNKNIGSYVRAIRSFTSITVYAIGDIGPAGGWIFSKIGNNYLECAHDDISINAVTWSNVINVAIGTTSTDLGTGQSNTLIIISQVDHTSSAAKLCDDLVITL